MGPPEGLPSGMFFVQVRGSGERHRLRAAWNGYVARSLFAATLDAACRAFFENDHCPARTTISSSCFSAIAALKLLAWRDASNYEASKGGKVVRFPDSMPNGITDSAGVR